MIANPTKATGSFIAMRLTQPRVRTRLFAGFGVLIMLAAGIAGLSIERQAEMSSRLTTMDSKAKSLRRLDETALLLESTRRAALRFEFDADPTALKTVRTDLAAIAEILARQTLAAAPMEQQQADMSLGKNLPIYAGQFERLVELQSMTAGLLAKLSDTGPSLTEKVAQLADAARAAADPELLPAAIVVGQAITRLRRDGLGFLTSGDPAWHSTILADREDAGAGLLALEAIADDATRPIAANLTATLSVLGGHFEAAVAARSESASLYSSVMLPEMIAMQDQIRQARQTMEVQLTAIRGSTKDMLAATSRLHAAIAAITLVLGIGVAFFLGRGIIVPLTLITQTMTRLASGDTTVDVPARGSKDEIGDMARAVEVFRLNRIRADRLTANQTEHYQRKAVRQDAMDETSEEFGGSVTKVMDTLMGSAAGMYHAAGEMTAASASMHEESSATSAGAKQSSDNLNRVALSVDALSAGFDGTTREVSTAAAASRQAVQQVEASQEIIRGLSESTSRIGDVVRLIKDIAGQTNLLALNATIEAARAGDAGKGFAVVAGEVKALAGQTARATAEISSQIDNVRRATEATIAAMTEIGGMIGKIDQAASSVVVSVDQQSVVTHEVAASIKQVSADIERSAADMAQVISIADQQAVLASQQLLFGVTDIGQEVETLREVVEKFIEAVRVEAAERRSSERIDGQSAEVSLLLPGQDAIQAMVKDLSVGGAALWTSAPLAPGTEIAVALPGATGLVKGKAIRFADGCLSIQFDQDPETRAQAASAFHELAGYATGPAALSA